MSYYIVPNESETVLSGMSLYYDSMYVSSGGTAADTTLDHGGSMYVSSGGTATETTLYYYGSMYVCSSGLADKTTVNGGTLVVSSSGLADNTTINTGVLYIYSGGTADNTTANLGCGLYISSGGTATNILENGGNVVVYSGGTATFTPNVLNDLVASDSCHITIHSGTTAVNANLMNASMFVYSGGTATGTTIVNWGLLRVNNGLAENTVVDSRARVEVSSGGTAKNTTVSGGSINVYTGANVDGVSIASGGLLYMVDGGSMTGVTAEDGVILYVYLATETCLSGTSGGKEISISEGNLNGLEFGSSGTLVVSNYVTATSAVIGPGARMIIDSYGSAVDVVENGGNVILNGGNAARVTYKKHEFKDVVLEDSGTYYGTTATVHSGTTATNTTIGGSAVMCVYSGGSVNSATVSAITISSGSSQYLRGGSMFVYSGGIADGVIRASELGKVTISSGAVVADGLQLIEDGGGFELDSDVEAAIVSRIVPHEFGGRTLSGLVTVHSGTTATDVTFTSGTFHLYSGGVLNNFTMSDANLVVHSGVELVSAVECSEYRGGTVTVESGAVVTGISRCNAVINGTVTNAIVGNGQRSYIRFDVGSGGKLISATALQSGGIFVSSGGLVEDSILEYGWGAVYSGGSVKNMTLMKGGDYDIYGGVFDGGQGYGYLSVESGGSLKNLTLSGGGLAVRNATATDFTISNGGLGVYGGTATDFTLAGSASISFSVDPTDGTYISGTIMKGETPTTILIQDGKVKDLNMRGTIYLENGGTADNITFSGGNAVISSGCTATNLKFIGMESGGGVYIDKYGYLNGAIFESGTGLTMSYYASAANVSALGGGITMVDTCRIDNALIANGGVMSMLAYEGDAPVAVGTVLSHGLVTSTYHDDYNDVDSTWTEDKGCSLLAYWNAVFSDTTVWEKGTATVGSYGHASNTTVHSGGSMVISARGEASGVTVSSGGSLRIEDFGTATGVNVLSGGRVFMYINSNTHVSGTYEGNTFAVDGTLTSTIGPGFSYNVTSGGAVTVPTLTIGEDESLFVYSSATFQGDLTVNRGGNVYIDYSTNASGTVQENGGWVSISNENVTFLSNTIDKLQVTSGYSATAHSNTVANSTLIQGVASEDNWKWSQLDVEGGVVYDTEIRENGQLYVNRSGSAFRTRVYTGGDLYLYESSFASDAVATGSDALIEVGYSCTAVSATLNDHASMYIWNSGLASSTTVSGGASMYVGGGSAIDTVVLGGSMLVQGYFYSSGVCNASNTTVGAGGSMLVYSYGLAVDTTVNAGGSMAVCSSGSAINATIASGAGMEVWSGGEVSSATIASGASLTVHDWGYVYDTTIESGGVMHVSSGYAYDNIVEAGGAIHVSSEGAASNTMLKGALHLSSGGDAYDTTVEANGTLHVSSGGWAYNTTVETDGDLHVSSGGVAYNTTVVADGVLHVESGGILAGTISVADGGEIAADGGIIAFDLTYSSPGTNIRVDNMAAITGNPDYRIGIWPGYSSDGVYTFASGAESFTGTMTLVDGDEVELGTLAVGEAIEVSGKYFMLTNDDGNLALMVSAYPLVRDDGPDDHWNNYVYDKKNKENPENPELDNFVVNELAEGVTEVFVDRKYSVVVDGMHNFAGKVQGFEPYEDDLADYAKIELATGAKLTFDVDSHIAGKFVIYSYDEATKKLKSLQSTSVKLNKDGSAKTTSTKEKFLEAGTYYVSMQVSVPKKKYAPDGFYNVKVGSNTVYFSDDDSGWNNWLYDKKKTPDVNTNLNTCWLDYAGQNIRADNTGYYAGDAYYQNFVGFGDDTDFVKIHLYTAANLSLRLYGAGAAADVKNSGALKVVVYSFDEAKKKMTALQTTSVKAADLIAGTANTKLKLLEAGDYYISVTSSNAKKGDKVYYTMSVGNSTVFFDDIDYGWNDYVYDAKNAEHPVNTDVTENDGFTVKTDNKGEIVNFDYDGYWFKGQEYTGFVGHNDEKDFVKINIAKAGTASFNVVATDAAKIEIWSFDTDKYKMKSLQSTALKKTEVVDGVQMYGIDTKAYAFKEPGEYYLSITSTNAKTGGAAYYNVTLLDTDIVDSAGDADALAMPETDTLGISEALSFGGYETDVLANASASSLAELDDKTAWLNITSLA